MQTSICVSNISLNILKFLNFLKIRPNPTWSDLIRLGLAIKSLGTRLAIQSDFYTCLNENRFLGLFEVTTHGLQELQSI
jgi:hypothetical protein